MGFWSGLTIGLFIGNLQGMMVMSWVQINKGKDPTSPSGHPSNPEAVKDVP